MKKFLLSALGLALLASAQTLLAKDVPAKALPVVEPAAAAAEGPQTVAVLSISGYDRIISDLAFIGQVAGTPGLEKQAEGMLMFFAQGLNGLDRTRPWGLAVSTDGTAFTPLIFLPVSDAKQLLNSLQGLVGPADDAGDSIWSVEKNNQKLFVKEKEGWAYVSQTAEALADVPAEPQKQLEGLDKTYEIALQVRVANIPEMWRSFVLDQVKMGASQGLQRQPDEDDATFELRQQMVQNQMKTIEDLFNETDRFTVGWLLDQKQKVTGLDVTVTGKTGSNLAKKLSNLKDAASNYSGFIAPKSAVSLGLVQTLAKEDIQQTIAAIDTVKVSIQKEIDKSDDLPDDAAKSVAKEMLNDLIEALKATVATGKADAGASLLLGSKTLTGLVGVYVAEPLRVEKAIKKLAEVASHDPNVPKIAFDAEKYGDVRFHTAKFPVPASEDIAKVIGGTLDVAVGIGPKSVYLGIGTGALDGIKKAIDRSKSNTAKVGPGNIDVALAPIFEFANAVKPTPVAGALATAAAKTAGKDHITLTAKPVSNGLTYHLEAQEGVLSLIGTAAKLQNAPPQGRGR